LGDSFAVTDLEIIRILVLSDLWKPMFATLKLHFWHHITHQLLWTKCALSGVIMDCLANLEWFLCSYQCIVLEWFGFQLVLVMFIILVRVECRRIDVTLFMHNVA
jgi:hypothetical protein